MRKDFCAFILSHGRPERVRTYETLMKSGYTGAVYIVIDDEDVTADQYRKKFGDKVLMFGKKEIAKTFDEGDSFGDRRSIVYARNACFGLAKEKGHKYFIQLDDDYSGFYYRYDSELKYGSYLLKGTLDNLLNELVRFFEKTGALTVAISQGVDHIGGSNMVRLTRKAMNTFICSVDRPFQFFGRINEDVNTYVAAGRRGGLFLTVTQAQVNQLATQSNPGGMTDLYLNSGTYVKTFYSVMYAPSCVKIAELSDPRSPHRRIHHKIDWNAAVPVIIPEAYRKS